MAVDWGSVPDWLVAFAAVGAAAQGIWSLSAWRREAGGRRRIELAEEILTGVYQFVNVIDQIRSPFSSLGENFDRPGRENEANEIQRHRDTFYPVLRRLRESQTTFDSMQAQQFRAKAIFGQDFEVAFDELFAIRREIYAAAITLFDDGTMSDHEEDRQAYRGMRDVIWRRPKADTITPRLGSAVEVIEGKLRPIINGSVR